MGSRVGKRIPQESRRLWVESSLRPLRPWREDFCFPWLNVLTQRPQRSPRLRNFGQAATETVENRGILEIRGSGIESFPFLFQIFSVFRGCCAVLDCSPVQGGADFWHLSRGAKGFPTLYRRSALRSGLRLPSDNPPGCLNRSPRRNLQQEEKPKMVHAKTLRRQGEGE